MRKLFLLFMTATLLFAFSSCKSSGGGSDGLLAMLGLAGNNLEVESTTPVNNATNVPRNQSIVVNLNAVIDDKTVDSTTFSIRETVAGTAVAGTYERIGNTIIFNPDDPLDASKAYTVTLTTGLNNSGDDPLLLKSNYVFSFTTGTTTDSTPPTVTATTPADEATDVAVNTTIQITFSEAVIAEQLDISIDPSVTISSFSVNSNIITIGIDGDLDNDTIYKVTVGTGVTDVAGNPLASAYTFSFMTDLGPDVTGPTVLTSDPEDDATGVSVNKTMMVMFSEAVRASSITSSTVVLRHDTTTVPCTRDNSGAAMGIIQITPNAALALNTEYTLTLTTGITDTSNNPMESEFTISFTTEASGDTTAPTLTYTSPADEATVDPSDLYYTSPVTGYFIMMSFDDDIDNTTISGITLVGDSEGSISITPISSGNIVAIYMTSALANDTYTVTLPSSITDDAGNHYAGSTFSFTVDDGSGDTTAPTFSSSDPTNGATGVSVSKTIMFVFNEAIDPASVSSSTLTLKQGTTVITCTRDTSAAAMGMIMITPSADLDLDTVYTATCTTGITDTSGNPLASEVVISFTTETSADETPPTLSSTTPADGATVTAASLYYDYGTITGYFIVVVFDDDIDNTTVSGITLVGDSEGEITLMGVSASGPMVIIGMSGPLAADTYTVNLPSSITDDAGNAYAGGSFGFTITE